MAKQPTKCSKCDGRMERGFVLDYAHGALLVSQWAQGQPKKSFWRRTVLPKKEQLFPVGTFRCSSCGYLESYAGREFAAE